METMTASITCKFNFTEEVVEAFTHGDCWVLAHALASHGHPVVTSSFKGEKWWNHAANMLPSGHIVDIMGIHEADDWIKYWATEAMVEHEVVGTPNQMMIKNWGLTSFQDETDEVFVKPKVGPMFVSISQYAGDYANKIIAIMG